jgi:hypothetical protein
MTLTLNPLRQRLGTPTPVMANEDLEAYQLHLKSFTDEYNPQGATESHLVQSLADTSWRLNRVASLEVNLLTVAVGDVAACAKALVNLSLHSQRLSRQFERTVAQLRDLQQSRRTQEKRDLDHVLDIMEMYESKGETYRPSEDGFVFSATQITQHRRTRSLAKAAGA